MGITKRQAESIAASVTPAEMEKARRVYEAHGWTKPDGGIGIKAGWSFTLVPRSILNDTRITTRERMKGGGLQGRPARGTVTERMVGFRGAMVAVALCYFANEKGICWPSWGAIQAVSRLHRRDIGRGIQELEEAGYLERDRGAWRPGKKGVVTVYCLRAAARRRRPK